MVVIRLARGGSKKRPFYHVHVSEKSMPRDGRYIDRIGYFNPLARGGETRLHIDLAKLDEWVGKGAQPSPRVKSLAKELRKQEKQAA